MSARAARTEYQAMIARPHSAKIDKTRRPTEIKNCTGCLQLKHLLHYHNNRLFAEVTRKIMPKNIGLKMTGLVVACALSLSAANMPMIGMVSSDPGQAGVRIDGERVSSNATLFEGSEVTSPGYSRLQLNSGTRVNLGANSVV